MKLVVKPDAEMDIKQAYDWYAKINPRLAERFRTELDHGFANIVKHPRRVSRDSGAHDIYRSCTQ